MKQLLSVDNLQNYPREIIRELEELLLSGGSALPDPKRRGFYDLEGQERTFFIHVSSMAGRVALLATWQNKLLGQSDSGLHGIEKRIRLRAYELYEQRGRRDGHAVDDWLQAEAELRGRRVLGAAA